MELKQLQQVLLHADQFRQAVALSAGGHQGNLRVDFVASSIRRLPSAAAHFRKRFPRVDLHLAEGNTDTIMASLRDGRSDVAIVRYPTPNMPSVTTEVLERNRYMAALQEDHPKALRPTLRLRELRDEPFIFPSSETTHYTTALMACQNAGFMPNIVHQASHAQFIVALVESGMGVALVPDPWIELVERKVAFKPLLGLHGAQTGLALAYRAGEGSAPLIANFWASVMATLVKPGARQNLPGLA